MSSQLHKLDTVKHIFTFLILICLLLLTLPAVAQKEGIETGPGHDQAAPAPTTPAPQDKTFWNQQYLLGDWGGERTKLAEEKGVTFDFFYVADFLGTPEAAV